MIFNEIKKAVQSALDFLHPIIDSKEPVTFKGTTAEWNALTPAEQAAFEVKYITDDVSTVSNFHYKSGTVNFYCGENSWNTVDITFDSPMPDTDYVVTLESGNTAYVHVQNVTFKTVNGFTVIVWNRDALTDLRGIINWQAFKIPR